MSREEFITNYLKTEAKAWIEDANGVGTFDGSVTFALIGSIYDLQQQISELQDKLDGKYTQDADSCPQCGSKDRCKMSCDEKWR